MEFIFAGSRQRIRFDYEFDISTGQPFECLAWIETRYGKNWKRDSTLTGSAQIREHSYIQQDKERAKLQAAVNGLSLRPALRKQMMRAIRSNTSLPAFNKETGRKLALARYMKLTKMSRVARCAVWDAYFARHKQQPTIIKTTANDIINAIAAGRQLPKALPGKSLKMSDEEVEEALWRYQAEEDARIEEEQWREWNEVHQHVGR